MSNVTAKEKSSKHLFHNLAVDNTGISTKTNIGTLYFNLNWANN